jgi:hypothetical protein
MAWFKPEDVPPGTEAQNNANYGIVVKQGWHEGIYYTHEKKFGMDHWLKGEKADKEEAAGTESDSEFEPGRFHHVVGVVDQAAGKTTIYVNGRQEGSDDFDAKRKPRDFEGATWKIGIAEPDSDEWSWPAKGLIDDVRLYSRALGEEQIGKIYEAGKAGRAK